MDNFDTMKKPEGGQSQPALDTAKLPVHSNAASDQRARLLAWLRAYGQIDTIAARRDLDIMMPAARVHELRHRFGHTIDLVWTREPTDCGKLHRVGRYIFRPEA